LQDGVLVRKPGRKVELVADRRLAVIDVVADRDVDRIAHAVVKPVGVRPDARLFKWEHGKRRCQIRVALRVLGDERIDIRRIRRVI